MLGYITKIREISERLLKEGKVDMVIGFRKGTVPMMNEPCVVKNPENVKELVWDSNCGINLANYLTDRKEKIGVVAKGCDSRNIVTHLIENKIKRDQLFIIGVPCKGMIDRHKITSMFAKEIKEVVEEENRIIVRGDDYEKIFKKAEVLQENCAICIHRNPVIYDELAADLVEEQKDVDRYEDVRRIEAMPAEKKGNYFDNLLSACIRCYACRNACPLCYCLTCFVDESRPQWVGKSINPTDIRTFHFLRAYHCAGRCTDCGACERACPMGIKVREFTKKLEKDCFELYGWEAGMSLDERPPLDTYRPDDPDFIK
ncbi:MAG: 4Fe-4S dicluster domain-containing protein [Desulfobacteraceae bacterium]|uniref:4Fe-4S dicluster domain-containing protein n=1 Tax=Candidatus Desulfaltia bathyphila TaxID=2841697 RepID=A0A8J6N743_9BACT|nr:4Fe-4S dicluster domain-containing protein [Candidatus Desulfaltia bathyphila]MBL7195327.1 4Fe-4S dicluster domain-containing protein [Desulfobacterales bacterium]